jgi:hypothetical protein
MAILGGLFFLRVIGQMLVTWRKVRWLPAVEHWRSGLLPYPVLVAAQAAILGLMGSMVSGVWRGRGRFAKSRPRLGRWVRGFGVVYFASMVVRHVVTMIVRPQWRWFGHTIPIIFHCILATYLLVYSGALLRDVRPAEPEGDRTGASVPSGR